MLRWRRIGSRWIVIALLAAALCPAAAAVEPPAVQVDPFDREVYGDPEDGAAGARKRVERKLQQRIAAVDRACGLTDSQRRKLNLAGRGDVRSLFEQLDVKKQTLFPEGVPRLFFVFPHDDELLALRARLRARPFDDDSLFEKTLRNILTPEQIARREAFLAAAAAAHKPITAENAGDLVRVARVPKDVYRIRWSRDGRQVGLHGFLQHVDRCRLPDLEVAGQLGAGRNVADFAISPDERHAALSSNADVVALIDLQTGQEISLRIGSSQASVRFSPDGRWLATGGYGQPARLWSVDTGALLREMDTGPMEGGLTVVFSPDGARLAVGNRNSTTRVFDVRSGGLLFTLDKRMSHELKFDPAGEKLAVVYVDRTLALWDAATGKHLRSVQALGTELYSVDWSPDGKLLATSGLYAPVSVWRAADLSRVHELDSPDWTICVRFSPDGSQLWFSGGTRVKTPDRHLEIWAAP